MKRGEIYWADLSPVTGSEEGGRRPVLILSNDVGNMFSPTVIVASITSKLKKEDAVYHVVIREPLRHKSVIQLEQLRTIDKKRIENRVGVLKYRDMMRVNEALKIALDMQGWTQ